MYILLGAGLLTAAALILSWAIGAIRRPNPSRWTQYEAVSVTASLIVSSCLAFGIGFLVAGLASFPTEFAAVGGIGLAGAAAMLIVAAILSPRLWAPGRMPRPSADILPITPHGAPPAPKAPHRKAA